MARSLVRNLFGVTFILAMLVLPLRAEDGQSQIELFNQAQRSFKNIQYDNAINAYSAAIAADPTSDTALQAEFEIARCYHYQWSIETAVAHFRLFVVNHPSHPLAAQAQKWIGDGYYLIERYDDAVREYKKLLTDQPNSKWVPETLYGLGRSYMKLRDWPNAINEFQMILSKYPDSSIVPQARAALEQSKTLSGNPDISKE